ncbi:MAG: N-acetyl-alpha-D-glucosaminyl L-malate synthase BshA [Candidatus Heimdallarchaeota archaeon]|nr:N-acetyl-alpha-D-glucosaminyl L-malate synthase BshA [Candidatus Heimdallarchaeota archaeon]MDH5646127.1 N-acetyl-alpha-D-glucosaminyl L-malate synthase BshA [Candidatus Heimdallarchaeota archaeon]
MKVLITGFPTMGGSGLVASNLGIELAKYDVDVHFLFYKIPFFIDEIPSNITIHQNESTNYELFTDIGNPYTIQTASNISKIVKEHQIDLVHAHYAIPHATILYLAKRLNSIKTINTTHGSDTHTLGKLDSYNSIIKLSLQDSNLNTSVSKFLARETEEVFELDKNSVKVIYNFINSDRFKPYHEEKELSIIHASNFRPIKQVPLMIEVFAEASKDFPDWKLNLIGYGPDYPICVRLARKLKVRDKVNFLGVQKDVSNLFMKSSIMASTSQLESFGLTIAEGMACSLPIWAPNTGGIPEVCIDKSNGLLWSVNDFEMQVNTLKRLMGNRKLRLEYGNNGRKRIIEQFSPEKIVKSYIQAYDELL